MKALVCAFNQEKALVEAFFVIVQLHRLIDLRHYSRSIIPSPAGEQQTPRLFKDWVSVSAGTQITNCSSHTFLRPRPGREAACAQDFHLPPHTEIINTGIGHEQHSRTAFLHCISQVSLGRVQTPVFNSVLKDSLIFIEDMF